MSAISNITTSLREVPSFFYFKAFEFQHHMWRGWGYIILVIVLAVLFNLHHFFELTYGTYDQLYCAEGSGSEGWSDISHWIICMWKMRRNISSSDSHIFLLALARAVVGALVVFFILLPLLWRWIPSTTILALDATFLEVTTNSKKLLTCLTILLEKVLSRWFCWLFSVAGL